MRRYGTWPISYFCSLEWNAQGHVCRLLLLFLPTQCFKPLLSHLTLSFLFFNLYMNNISISIYPSQYYFIVMRLWQRIVFIMGGTASTFPRFHNEYPTFLVFNTDCVDIYATPPKELITTRAFFYYNFILFFYIQSYLSCVVDPKIKFYSYSLFILYTYSSERYTNMVKLLKKMQLYLVSNSPYFDYVQLCTVL